MLCGLKWVRSGSGNIYKDEIGLKWVGIASVINVIKIRLRMIMSICDIRMSTSMYQMSCLTSCDEYYEQHSSWVIFTNMVVWMHLNQHFSILCTIIQYAQQKSEYLVVWWLSGLSVWCFERLVVCRIVHLNDRCCMRIKCPYALKWLIFKILGVWVYLVMQSKCKIFLAKIQCHLEFSYEKNDNMVRSMMSFNC